MTEDEMEATTEQTNDVQQPIGWTDVAGASAAVDAERWEEEIVETTIELTLTDADLAGMLRENGADEDAKSAVDREIDALKAELKEKKAESESIASRIKERNRAGARGKANKAGEWKQLTCFALNTRRFVDPASGAVVYERPLTSGERQLSLTAVDGGGEVIDIAAARKDAEAGDGTAISDPAALLEAARRGEDPDPEDESLDSEDDEDDS